MKNKLYAVGIGPGCYEQLTVQAVNVLNSVDVIVGYPLYVNLIKEHFPDKAYMTLPMGKEPERCRLALSSAAKGKVTAMVCSGDAGIYGMAGLLYELLEEYEGVEIEVIPGVTAALSGGAVLGAPLMNDCCFISLSDWLTPWEDIEKRLIYAARTGFAICIYNPSSKVRRDYLKKACSLLLKELENDTVCAIVRNIGREGQRYQIMTLKELKAYEADMFTTVFIGNKMTYAKDNHMVTKRGYLL